ncbi:GntR family transcriptional regulator [Luteimonas sp. 22616]|uniref:GntR family transcriptional regulator n=1 Tax=Luteimonas sp. 22616 TaxID=3453951 RepID=UPI003F83BBFE
MSAIQSKSAFLYREIRRALRSGRYVPGQRIDPATIAEEFHTSATPVRFALYRLVGEGLIADHARSGLYVPLLTEVALRDLYDWMRRLLLMACEIGIEVTPLAATDSRVVSTEDDIPNLTWHLFDSIARATDHRSLHQAVKQANDRLAPIRRAGRVDDACEELSALIRHWQECDIGSLSAGLSAYHERRKQLVPHIVASLGDNSDLFN